MKKLDRITKAVFVVILLLTGCLFLYSLFGTYSNDEAYVGSFSANGLNDGWTLVGADGSVEENVRLPRDARMTAGQAVLLRNTLPADISGGMRLCVRSQRQDVRVFINGEERGNYLAQNVVQGWRIAPSAFLLVDLRDGDALGTVELQIVPAVTEAGRLNEVTYAFGNNVWFSLIVRNAGRVIVADLMVCLGVTAILAYLLSRKHLHFANSVLYLAEAIVVAGLWMLSESELRQMLFRTPSLSNVFAFLLIEILPAFLMMFFNELQERRYEKGYVALETASLVLLLANCALNAARIVPFYQSIRVFHALSGVMLVYTQWTVIRDIRTKQIRRYRITAFGILLLTVSLLLELVNFYSAGSSGGFGAFLGFGLLLLLGATALQVISNELEMAREMRAAESANRAKSDFLAGMSHEIRTPINAILGMDELILRESDEPETLARAEDIRNAGRTLLALINDILDFSRIEEGRMELMPVQYELGAMLGDLVSMIRVRAESKGLRLEVRLDENTPRLLCGDEMRIRQCVMNLLTNAVKYTERGTVTLTVGFEPADGDTILLRFSVRDTGIGLKAEDLDKLCAPFTRIEETRNRTIEGTGLGLSITRQLLELMGSRLEVQSVYGAGSTFSFAIRQPVVDGAPVGRFAGRREEGAARSDYRARFRAPEASVLAVDDMPVNLNVIRGLLKKTELRVDTAVSGEEALALAAGQSYDVFLIDHMMPGMDGIETLHALRQMPGAAGAAYIALTANAISGARERYLAAGFTDYLAKPVEGAQLEEVLLRCLPAEKVLPGALAAEGPPETALPESLYRIEGLDAVTGLKYCGAAESYLETLAIYADNAAPIAAEIEALRRAGDLDGVTMKVHALKSGSRAIGAGALSALAERLETAGKAGDAQTLDGGLDELLTRLRTLGERLSALKGDGTADDRPLLTAAELRERYDTMRALLAGLEYDGVAAEAERLAGCRVPEEERERCERICGAARTFDWDEIGALLP